MRRAAALLVALAVVACDTMIADRIVITTPANQLGAELSASAVLAVVRETLASSGLKEVSHANSSEEWEWRSEKPPGLHATVDLSREGVRVRLSQDLYGPIGPTEKYKSVRTNLIETIEGLVGKEAVHVE